VAALSPKANHRANPFAGPSRWLVIDFRLPVTIGCDAISRAQYTNRCTCMQRAPYVRKMQQHNAISIEENSGSLPLQ
jgi:hypothetical protein